MIARNHIMFGVASWVLARPYIYGDQKDWFPLYLEVVLVGVGSLLPDIDHPSSRAGKFVPFISYPVSAFFGHRGVTHSLIAVVACVYGLFWASGDLPLWGLYLVWGYMSHLLGDYVFGTSGLPLTWPAKRRFVSPINFSVNGVIENVMCIAMFCYSIYFVMM
ncbi:metal-dependent hydrolase [Motilimonas eburnea]|uniref:metal-dependent hydrolase n=1 Tax=Motilimonas eburnea TaxID=1737488 RepID=UPI001E3DF200|nr:metal-dependent hydrolase [Motilimonas eburnea]MCE2571658.1 metal-dependent hydrolase [Motilimonas eburnea]